MNLKTTPLVLAMFTLVCGIIPAAGVIPSAIALEDTTSLDEDLALGIVSDALGGDDAADGEIIDQDSTDIPILNPNQEDQTVDHDTVTFGDNTAEIDDTNVGVPINVEEGPSTPTPDNRLQTEEVVFCFEPELNEFQKFSEF